MPELLRTPDGAATALPLHDAAFVGREFELSRLREHAQRAAAGSTQLVVIEGPPGIGKTALAQYAFDALGESARLAIRLDPQDRHVPGGTAWRVFHDGQEPADVPAVDVEFLVDGVLEAAAAVTGPAIILVDDLQWIDDLSAEALWLVLRALDRFRGLIVTTMRPNHRRLVQRLARFAQTSPDASYLRLDALSARDAQDLLRERTGLPIWRHASDRLRTVTGGYPLHLDIVARALAQAPAGERSVDGMLATLRGSTDPRLMSFDRAIHAALVDEGDEVALQLRALAVAQRPISIEDLGRLTATAVDTAPIVATGLVTANADRRTLRIDHAPVAGAIRASMSPEDLARLHLDVAAFEPEAALMHRLHAALAHPGSGETDPIVAEARATAARELHHGGTCVDRMLQLVRLDTSPETMRLALRGIAVSATPQRILEIEPAAAAMPAGPLRAALEARAAAARYRPVAALRILEEHEHALAGSDIADVLAYAEAAGAIGRMAAAIYRTDVATSVYFSALRELDARAVPDGDAENAGRVRGVRALLRVWCALAEVGPHNIEESIRVLADEAARADVVPDASEAAATAHSILGILLRQTGDNRVALTHLDAALAHSAAGAHHVTAVQTHRALIFFDAGLWPDADVAIEHALARLVETGEGPDAVYAHAVCALLCAGRGDAAGAHAALAQVAEFVPLAASPPVVALVDYAHAWLAMGGESEEEFADVAQRIADNPIGGSMIGGSVVSMLARGLYSGGYAELIPDLVDDAERVLLPHPDNPARFTLAYARGLHAWALDRPHDAASSLRAAIDQIARGPGLRTPGDRARGLGLFRALVAVDLATLVRDNSDALSGHRDRALSEVVAASSVFRRCGVSPLAARARRLAAEMRGLASAPAPSSARENGSVPAALTRREQQIAHFVADGLTNREIAEELVVSVRTVEFHVANALAKLGLTSRVELRHLVRAPRDA
ncbi:helix-turn-helix transcriptional regulator [Microbacterium excoecariae]|uniref:helix-turn-helix transcriptional regulator n=1 Tax=Microbacterium excoecariae TaxID=2715210 RepID=UPI00140DAFC7|nr:LuxR family transcriptional regulator [Microbacterium excoecariae]NHI17730.1 AAA family ATPase [Microbacterium excoecariae]